MTLRLPTTLAALAAAAAIATGCGSDKTETVTQTVGSATPPTATTPTVPTVPTVPTTTTDAGSPPPSTPPAGGGTVQDAEATLRDKGYRADNPDDYDPSATLRVLIGTRADSGDGYAKKAFFFVGDRFIGTDTSDESANIKVAGTTDDTVTLAYAIYRKGDALCCPGDSARVRYQWNGSRLVPLDAIPARSLRG
jgi:hypothetical protein